MLRFFKENAFGGCKLQIFVIWDKNTGRGVKVADARRPSVRFWDDFHWLGGHSAGLMAALLKKITFLNALSNLDPERKTNQLKAQINICSFGLVWFGLVIGNGM